MYTCGPTVYRYAHVGNLRSYLLADLIRRALLYHGIDVLHVKNITDVGHLRDERFDRGEDRMLVAAGLEDRRRRPRSPPRTRRPSTPTRPLVNILPGPRLPARHRAHPRDARASPSALEDAGHAYATADGQRLLRGRARSPATAGCRATRSTTCAPAIAARSSPTSATRPTSRCGRPPARAAS